MKNILFICTGNTCRSPMAEGILNKIAKQINLNIAVKSAGTNTNNGLPASDNALVAMKEKGIDITQHRSQQVTGDLLQWADIIITMGKNHQEYLKKSMPEKNIVVLYEYAKEEMSDVCDPWGADIAVYRACANEIETLIETMIDKGKLS